MSGNAREEYGDIIDLEHYVSPDHPQMARLNRAAQFSPFAALTGYEDLIDEAARETDAQIEVIDEVKEALDRRLFFLLHQAAPTPVTITWFRPDEKKTGGSYETSTGIIRKYDPYARCLLLDTGETIFVDSITDLTCDRFDSVYD